MRTDTEMTLLSTTVLHALDDLRFYVERHGQLMDLLAQKDAHIASLERQSDLDDVTIERLRERVSELTARCVELERKVADGLAHDDDRG